MRRALVAIAVLAALVLIAVASLRRLPSGALGWSPRTGRLVAAAPGGALLPRWKFRSAGRAPVSTLVQAASREGSRVTVALRISPTPGEFLLAPADTVAEGLEKAVRDDVSRLLAASPLACLADLSPPGCQAAVKERLIEAVAARLGVGGGGVEADLVPDPTAIAQVRRAALAIAVKEAARRVVVIGLDGADWEVLEPFTRRGVMPNLARLMAAGTYGDLDSITPVLSPLIWTTMATGASPEEHGILDFVEVDPASGARIPVTGRQRRLPALWNMASAAGLSPVVAGWWATWPAEMVNGVMISDRLFYLLSGTVGDGEPGTVVFPPQLEPELRELAARAVRETGEEAVRALMPVSWQAYRDAIAAGKGMADPIDGFRRILVGTRTYFGAALTAVRPTTDLLMVYCIGTDEIGHLLAPYLPPLLPGREAAMSEAARTAVERYHNVVDRWIGRLLEVCPLSECAVLVVSDHGFKWGADRPRDLSGVAAATAAVWHRPTGIFIVAGHGVERRGRVSENASVFDVAPSVAALLGIPPGVGWRGRPLPGCPPARLEPVDWSALVPPEGYRGTLATGVRPSAEAIAQLKALGYLEGGEGSSGSTGITEGSLNNLGLVHLEAKRYRKAEEAFLKAIETNPSYASPHYNLRRLYLETSRFEEADRSLWRAVELGLRDGAGAVDRAASDWEARNMPERALDLLTRGTARFPGEERLHLHQLALLVRLGRCSDAMVAGQQAANLFPFSAGIHAFTGLAAACTGATAEARTHLRRSLELDPDQPVIKDALAALSP
ncbi:MAG: alkaline phosphatase family protein [Acidobacteriota bacterium]